VNVSAVLRKDVSHTLIEFSAWILLGDDHKFLEGQTTASVRSSIDHIHERNWENVGFLRPGEVRDMGVQRHILLIDIGVSCYLFPSRFSDGLPSQQHQPWPQPD